MKKESDGFANKDEKTNAGTSVLKKKRNLWFYVSLVFFFSTIGVYFWKEYQINQTKKTYTLKANDLLNKTDHSILELLSSSKMESTFDSCVFIAIRTVNCIFSNRSCISFTYSSFSSISGVCSTN